MLVFIIQAFELKDDSGKLHEVTELQLYAKSYQEALKRAKKIINKPFYRLSMVIEKNVNHTS